MRVRSSTDRTLASEAGNTGSIPVERTRNLIFMPYENVYHQGRELARGANEKKTAAPTIDTVREKLANKKIVLERFQSSGDQDPTILNMISSLQTEIFGLQQKLQGQEETARALGSDGIALQLKTKTYELEKNQLQRRTPELDFKADQLKQEVADLRGLENYLQTTTATADAGQAELPARISGALQAPSDFQ